MIIIKAAAASVPKQQTQQLIVDTMISSTAEKWGEVLMSSPLNYEYQYNFVDVFYK